MLVASNNTKRKTRNTKLPMIKTTSFKQQLTVNLPAQTVFDMYMDARKHAKWIGAGVKMSKKVGGRFEVFDGYAYGTNIELMPGKKIVQVWIPQEEKWPDGHVSIVEFSFSSVGKNKCKITLHHKQIPSGMEKQFKDGWRDYYWTPLKQIATQS